MKRSLLPVAALAAFVLAGCPSPHEAKPTAPEAPSNLAAIAQSSSSIQVAWSDNSDNEDSFVLEYDTIAAFSGKTEISLATDTTVKLVEGLDAGTKHHFRVKAVNGVGSSAYSNVGEATTQDPPLQAPAGPSALTATAASSSSIQAGWSDNSDNEDNFVIAYSKTADFSISTTAILPANTTSNLVGSLDANTKYYLRVQATNSAGSSAWSDPAEATTPILIEGTMVLNGGADFTNNTTVSIHSAIAAATQMRFQNAGGAWSSWEPYAASKAWTLVLGEGTKTVNGEFQDAVGTVLAKSDSIILDTTPPAISLFIINSGATYATSTIVTLSCAVSGATQMRFWNTDEAAWSAWEPYAASKAWTLASDDEPKTVFAEFMDAAGNSKTANDVIILDTHAPDVYGFRINEGLSYAWTTAATLNMSVENATQMRFANEDMSWSSWETLQANRSWSILSFENRDVYVYAQFRDAAGNTVQVSDSIYYDGIRRLRFTAESIQIADDNDGLNPGDIFWQFYGYNTEDAYFAIYNLGQTEQVQIESGGTYDFPDVSVIIRMSNWPGESYRIALKIADDDGILGVGWSEEGSVVFYRDDPDANWGIGSRSLYAWGFNGPEGTMYFKVEKID